MGADHKPTFQFCAIVGEQRYKIGTGTTKSQAKKNAALYALQELDTVVNTGNII